MTATVHRIERGSSDIDGFLEKPLPSSPDAERCILGAVLLDPKLIAPAVEKLRTEDFYSPTHRMVFAAMGDLFRRGAEIDPVMVAEELKKHASVESIGGIAAITNLTYGVPHFADVDGYITIVRDKSKLRQLVRQCGVIQSNALAEDTDTEDVLSDAQSRVNELCAGVIDDDFAPVGELAQRAVMRYQEQRESGVVMPGLLTGFRQLDNAFLGFQKGELIILGARPRIGKTSMMLNWADGFAAQNPGAVVAVFSLEMKKDGALSKRMVCQNAQVSFDRFNRGFCTAEEHQRINAALVRMADHKVFVNDTPALSPMAVRAKCQALKAKHKRLDAVMIDFLQKMSPSRRRDNFRLEIASVAQELKNLAKDLDAPVITLSSLSRMSETRTDKRPMLSDLSESNAIESEADVVAFLYRDIIYNPQADPYDAEFIIAKHRNGAEQTIRLKWRGEYTTFEDR